MKRALVTKTIRALPHLLLIVVVGLSFLFVPQGKTLWAKVLGITGTINTGESKPPGHGGCTPGFWKQPHHFGHWNGYDPHEGLVTTTFDVSLQEDLSLLHALEHGGGGKYALLRHAVAALLNAANDEIDFQYDEGQVIDFIQNAFEDGSFEEIKDQLEEANEGICDLGRLEKDDLEVERFDRDPLVDPSPTATPPPSSGEACQPSEWAEITAWPDPFQRDTLLADAFDLEDLDELTLLEALAAEGDRTEALLRQATAALLNAASPQVDYELSVEVLIGYLGATLASEEDEAVPNTAQLLREANDGECPLTVALAKPTAEPTAETSLSPAPPTSTPSAEPTETPVPEPTNKAEVTDEPEPTGESETTDEPEPTPSETGTPPTEEATEPTPSESPEQDPSETPKASPTAEESPPPTDSPEPSASAEP